MFAQPLFCFVHPAMNLRANFKIFPASLPLVETKYKTCAFCGHSPSNTAQASKAKTASLLSSFAALPTEKEEVDGFGDLEGDIGFGDETDAAGGGGGGGGGGGAVETWQAAALWLTGLGVLPEVDSALAAEVRAPTIADFIVTLKDGVRHCVPVTSRLVMLRYVPSRDVASCPGFT
jgi:hypothetical protein